MPISDWEARLELQNAAGIGYVLSTEDGSIILGTEGEISLSLSPHATLSMNAGTYNWDLLLKDPQGVIHPPLLMGTATVKPIITQWV